MAEVKDKLFSPRCQAPLKTCKYSFLIQYIPLQPLRFVVDTFTALVKGIKIKVRKINSWEMFLSCQLYTSMTGK